MGAETGDLDKKYGIDREILLIAGGARFIQALLSSEPLLTHSGAATVARAGITGADLMMIATVMNQVNGRKSAAEMARLIDMSLFDELQREGFFERLSK